MVRSIHAPARSNRDDVEAIARADWSACPEVALEETKRLAGEEERRRQSAEGRASTYLLVAAALVPLLDLTGERCVGAKDWHGAQVADPADPRARCNLHHGYRRLGVPHPNGGDFCACRWDGPGEDVAGVTVAAFFDNRRARIAREKGRDCGSGDAPSRLWHA
jgi:hypothetical protein